MSIEPANLTAQLLHRAAGNPPSTLPDSAISNCFPGLEFDFRNVWRRLLEGIVLHEASGFVVSAEGENAGLASRFLISVADFPTLMDVRDPNGADAGAAFMEWSNALADVVAQHAGELVPCVFFDPRNPDADPETVELVVRPMFVPSEATKGPTSAIAEELVQPGELTQSLCSPWQNDYQECGCYYWAASRPDYVNVEHTAAGAIGNKWLARSREPKTYDVPDITHEELFRDWEGLLRFVIGGREAG
ncbi:MAG: hypothetical protein QOK16_555 [Solirubrobacteraceae bacterium]|jgi:hypothetical protein|nr:hypothetical protein [Solirubrobacteraceae bacterium]